MQEAQQMHGVGEGGGQPIVETMRLMRIDGVEAPGEMPRRGIVDRLRAAVARHRSYVAVVVAPTLLALVYFGLIAADRYESEARFTVRSPAAGGFGQIAGMVQGSTILKSADDAYIVHAYMRSRDALARLDTDPDFQASISAPGFDMPWQFPGLWFARSRERLWMYFQGFIDIDYDNSTGISTLKVVGFKPATARSIAETLLALSEELINRLSDRAQVDAIRIADAEVERAREHARETLAALTEFRRRNAVIDPNQISISGLELITQLTIELSEVRASIAEMQRSSPNSPQSVALQRRVEALEAQIEKERSALAGTGPSLAPTIAEYDRLALERGFAERSYASAQTALDIARLDATRQKLFLERISTPSLPDYPKYPRRLLSIVIVFAAMSILHAIGRKLVTDARSHGGP